MPFVLPAEKLEALRDRLRDRGRGRQSMLLPSANPDVVAAVEFVGEFGTLCEIAYLVMIADRRIRHVEREVLRGALDVLSNGRLRTAHMDAMLDASARSVGKRGVDESLERAVNELAQDPIKAELAVVVAAVVAAADGPIIPEEEAIIARLAAAFGYDPARAAELLDHADGALT